VQNTSIGIVGPSGQHETGVTSEGSFRILEEIQVYLKTMVPKETGEQPAAAPPPAAGDEDVQMVDQ
jgi:20S proteasome subunit alpha 6